MKTQIIDLNKVMEEFNLLVDSPLIFNRGMLDESPLTFTRILQELYLYNQAILRSDHETYWRIDTGNIPVNLQYNKFGNVIGYEAYYEINVENMAIDFGYYIKSLPMFIPSKRTFYYQQENIITLYIGEVGSVQI